MNGLYPFLSRVTGLPADSLWSEKIPHVLLGLLLLAIFLPVGWWWYRRYYGKTDLVLGKLMSVSLGVLLSVIAIKYAIYFFAKGYIPDRLLLYALPSPRVEHIGWFLLPCVVVWIGLWVCGRAERYTTRAYLACVIVFGWCFSVAVAAIRQGIYSIYEPFTRTYWEYTGNLPLVENVQQFIAQYVSLIPRLTDHGATHPPGYTVVLYLAEHWLHATTLGLALVVIAIGTLSVVPVFHFLRELMEEREARRGALLFVLLPSVVMFVATSMEAVFLCCVWFCIAWVFAGWQRHVWQAFVGGIMAGVSLFMNFLFLLLAPVFLALLLVAWRKASMKSRVVFRAIASFLGFVVVCVILHATTGYSFWENFIAARAANHSIVISNFSSLTLFFVFASMNITGFFLYLGTSSLVVLRDGMAAVRKQKDVALLGFFFVGFLVLLGMFQGEVERIWLFVTPLFVYPIMCAVRGYTETQWRAFLTLLCAQTIIMQIVFYTYW